MANCIVLLAILALTLYGVLILNRKTYENVLLVYGAITIFSGWLFLDIINYRKWYIYAAFILAASLGFILFQLFSKRKSYFIINFSVKEEMHFDELNDILKSFCRRNEIDKFYIELSVTHSNIITFHNINKGLIDACMIELIEYASNNLTEPKKNNQISGMINNIIFFAACTYLLISTI